jgi:predicted short-subunit dehydrogenase-like oxidoreductase (DUF2520 family)
VNNGKLQTMNKKPSITVIGAGSLALALVPALRAAGYAIEEIISRDNARSRGRARRLARAADARAMTLATAKLAADVVWFCVRDGAIAVCARELAKRTGWAGKTVLHSSGALSSGELESLHRLGARAASLHPMMTFVRRSAPSFAGVGFAVEGDRPAVAVAKRIGRDIGGEVFSIRKSAKPLYHAWGAFGSPLLVMELALAERVARASGIAPGAAKKIIEPMVRRTIDNYFAHGAAAAFSGPLVRGDVDTVRRHLQKLSRVPGAREVYVALARSALKTMPIARKRRFQEMFRPMANGQWPIAGLLQRAE